MHWDGSQRSHGNTHAHKHTHTPNPNRNKFVSVYGYRRWADLFLLCPHRCARALECDSTWTGYRFNEVHFSPCPDKSLYLFGTSRKANNVSLAGWLVFSALSLSLIFDGSLSRTHAHAPCACDDFWFQLHTQCTSCLSNVLTNSFAASWLWHFSAAQRTRRRHKRNERKRRKENGTQHYVLC